MEIDLIKWYLDNEAYIPVGDIPLVSAKDIKKLLNMTNEDIWNLSILVNEFNKIEKENTIDDATKSEQLNKIQELIMEYIGGMDDK